MTAPPSFPLDLLRTLRPLRRGNGAISLSYGHGCSYFVSKIPILTEDWGNSAARVRYHWQTTDFIELAAIGSVKNSTLSWHTPSPSGSSMREFPLFKRDEEPFVTF